MVEKKKIENIADIPGVGDKVASKLRTAGFHSLKSLAVAGTWRVMEASQLGEETSRKIISSARDALEIGYEPATQVLERRQKIGRITTGSSALDKLLGGGVETGSTTEFHGGFGSSKTQVGHQLAVNVQLPADKGGLEGAALFIDTESTFRPERIMDLAKANGLDPEEALKNVYVARAYDSDHQMLLVEQAADLVREHNIKLIVVDSVTAAFRSDFMGRGELSERQQKLNRHLHRLQEMAETYNLAVYMTNQVMSRPDIMFGDPTAPIGGHIMGHFSTYRIYVRKSKGDTRIARMIDSPNLPEGECVFTVTEQGIRDKDEE